MSNKKKCNKKKNHKKKHRKCYKKTNSKLYSIKVRLYPKDKEKLYASKNCGARRFVYNYLLAYVQNEHKRKIDNINAVHVEEQCMTLNRIFVMDNIESIS